METHRIDYIGIMKAFVIALGITSVSAVYAAGLRDATVSSLLSTLHIAEAVGENS